MKLLDDAVEFLNDGKWHTIKELGEKLKLGSYSLDLFFNFLVSHNFCEVNNNYSLKLREDYIVFFKRLEELKVGGV